MPSAANITLLGHVGYKNDIKYSGTLAILELSVAISRKEKDEYVTDWYKVVVFGKQAEYADTKITKGILVHVVGVPSINTYETKDGVSKTNVVIRTSYIAAIVPKPAVGSDNGGDMSLF